MNYIKKMCILRQAKQGFSGDGKTLSGLVKIEQYGKNLAIEVSVINFAPLVSGNYYCLLSDGKGKTEMLSLRGKSLFNILSDLDVSGGFCAVICYVKTEIIPVAYGVNGNGRYDFKKMLDKALPPIFPDSPKPEPAIAQPQEPLKTQDEPLKTGFYNDEKVATENYFEEKQDEQILLEKNGEDAYAESASESQEAEEGVRLTENGDAAHVLHPFAQNPDGYYCSVKEEVDKLFEKYPKDATLNGAFSCSAWVRLKGSENNPEFLLGVLYEDEKVKYICYALKAVDKNAPPEEIKNVSTFVPKNVFSDAEGFFLLFQSAATGECIKPSKA